MSWHLLTGLLLMAAPPDFSQPLGGSGGKAPTSVATLVSDGQQLVLDVDVVDTTPSAATDDVHSDHVEVWFGLEAPDALMPSRVVTTAPEGKLFTVSGKDDPKALDAIIQGKDPGTLDASGMAGEGCEEDDRAAREQLGMSPKRTRVLMGVAHWGFFPDGRAPVLYDLERYPGLSPALGEGDVRYEARKTATGYHVRAVLQPGALLFVPKDGVRTLRVRVDAIDAGAAGTKETLRSTHPAPKWGDAETLRTVKLAKPLTVKLVEGLPELGQPLPKAPGAKQAFDELPPYFLRTGKTWAGVRVLRESPESYQLRICAVTLDAVTGYRPQASVFEPPTPFLGNGTARIQVKAPGGPTTLYLSRAPNDLRAVLSSDAVETFRFKDGTPGLVERSEEPMMGRYTSGACGGATTVTLRLVRLEKQGPKRTVLMSWNDCGSEITDAEEHVVAERQEDGTEDAPKITWATPGQKLRVTFGPRLTLEATWSPDGSGVKVGKVAVRQ
ncbi:hypothetical protein COCOR_06046 [Corallococcus coralloides DSM 2259]|uniref:Uncharacterized protein n=1 Tax=Corallococcus coralloides (strain ATCC 25202 / DSM 2259 / NBRC 100086 / M2) TaxID=1144275 RepID=H8ML13_CORCM|nr:hypothetical protein [Corallococcus coralloides]AFE06726.1 hypothetical protein COCOR_06046 [Corallococcus coralloides DSM 2259]